MFQKPRVHCICQPSLEDKWSNELTVNYPTPYINGKSLVEIYFSSDHKCEFLVLFTPIRGKLCFVTERDISIMAGFPGWPSAYPSVKVRDAELSRDGMSRDVGSLTPTEFCVLNVKVSACCRLLIPGRRCIILIFSLLSTLRLVSCSSVYDAPENVEMLFLRIIEHFLYKTNKHSAHLRVLNYSRSHEIAFFKVITTSFNFAKRTV